MNALTLAKRSFLKKGRNNLIKILSLGTGLAVGLVLLAKVSFEQNFDNFYPDNDRIYQISTLFSQGKEEPRDFPQVSGAVAPGMKMEIPEVEVATRFTYITDKNATFSTSDGTKYKGQFILADDYFFDVLPRPMIAGNAKEILSQPMYAMVAKSIADKMGGNVIGKQITISSRPSNSIVIGGIFEDLPENSHISYDIIISLNSISKFMGDGRENWIGNDRYMGYVKLSKGVDPESLAPAVRKMQEKHQNIKEMEVKYGATLNYFFKALPSLHKNMPSVKRLVMLLSIIAFSLIVTAVLNYVLVVITTLVGRSKEIAVYKCYGASGKNITKLMFTETLFHFALSILLAVVLILCFRGAIENLLMAKLSSLFNWRSGMLLAFICTIIFIIAAMIPSFILSKIPVATVFRSFSKSRREWKLVLLFIQFAAASFLFILLVIVSKQYNLMINDNPGYTYNNTLYVSNEGVPKSTIQTVIEKLQQLPEVSIVASASDLPFSGFSGNNVSIPDTDQELFNVADMYYADKNYMLLMEIPIIQGKGFDESCTPRSVLVSQSFVEKMKVMVGWENVVGRDVNITEHGLCNIIGVFPDIRLGSISNEDKRPSVIFYDLTSPITLIKLNKFEDENIQKIYNVLQETMPNREIVLAPYRDNMVNMYSGERRFRDAISIGGIVTILIALLGLIGYINNEIVRRTAEIAIRKINGATLKNILTLFMKDILYIAPLAIIVGGVVSVIVANKWMENFSEKASLPPLLLIGCGLIILLFIEVVVALNCLKISNQNPIKSLKTD